MGSKQQAKANSENAKRMKEMGIRRTTVNCPMGCGSQIPFKSQVFHLGNCTGKKK